jgi:glycosyltransferase involved in cell wall biosynthesis
MTDQKPIISVVIPVYEAEECLEELYIRLTQSLGALTTNYEVILVEDRSTDGSWLKVLDLVKRDERVKGIRFSRNFGQHYGITAGLDHCSGEWVVVMDCDLQDRPEEIPRLYHRAKEGFDVVLARRMRRKDGKIKQLTSAVFYKIFGYLADIEYDGCSGNFRIISRRVVVSLSMMRERLRFFGGLVQWMGYPTTTIDVEHARRFRGTSTYNFSKLWKLAVETIIAYSDKPLRLSIRFGLVISGLSFSYGLYVFCKALLYGSEVAGWSSLIVSINFIGGIIISTLGMIGIYLGKTFDEIKKRPLYIVSESTFLDDK